MVFGHFHHPNAEWKWLLSDMNDAVDNDEDLLPNCMQI